MANFPPPGPVTQTTAIPSYPYKEYDDDPFAAPFFAAYNQVAQDYVDTVNALNLPIYTGANINGLLLDWVGGGIYGFPRPTIGGAGTPGVGTLNTYQLNALTLNTLTRGTAGVAQTASDDIYKRCLTWHIFKGEGKYFTIKSLKRRVMRFLLGTNGTAPNIDQTYQISVSFGPNHEVTIRFINELIQTLRSAQLNTFQLNTTLLNSSVNQITLLNPLPFEQVFQDAVLSGALELPFQYNWEVVITGSDKPRPPKPVKASLSTTEAKDTASFSAVSAPITTTLTTTEAPDVAHFTASNPPSGAPGLDFNNPANSQYLGRI
jgi:hypothetical protein